MIVGMTDYNDLSLNEIYKDVLKWQEFASESENKIKNGKRGRQTV